MPESPAMQLPTAIGRNARTAAVAPLALFAAAIALAALLLFLIQPIIAKQILPWFGGGAGIWTTCMVFFQTVLLAGYAYAHWLSKQAAPRVQWVVHSALLGASLLFLPVLAAERLRPSGGQDAALAILVLLAATIGLPYFLLAATGPLLQSWLARRWPTHSLYRLFALSNAGSLAALLAFPLLFEPRWGTVALAMGWSAAYAVFAAICCAAASLAAFMPPSTPVPRAPAGSAAAAPAAHGQWTWLVLSALGVVILLGATAHISQNVASVPFLWLVPLVLYLLSFVLAFEGRGGRGWYGPGWGVPVALGACVAMAAGLSASSGVLDVLLAVPLYCIGVLFTCLFCHGELAARRPHPSQLTRFYLMISLGGALGGLFAGLLAPRAFDSVYEFPLALAALCAAAFASSWQRRDPGSRPRRMLCALAAIACVATLYWDAVYVRFLRSDVIWMHRNFYGTLRVREVGEGDKQVRRLMHGVILHGEQYTRAADRLEPGTYYVRSSGVGLAIAAAQHRVASMRLGVVGLGAGTLAAYGRSGDTVRFYELDPDVVDIARRYFTYLSSSPAAIQIALGDARLSLQRELAAGQNPRFDVLAIDAFSSDSIPVHLLTRQALDMYRRCLAPGGVIAIHISNRFLDLKPVLANLAADLRLNARLVSDEADDDNPRAATSDWVLIAEEAHALSGEPLGARTETLNTDPSVGVWTDQFNNLLGIVKSRPLHAIQSLWSDD